MKHTQSSHKKTRYLSYNNIKIKKKVKQNENKTNSKSEFGLICLYFKRRTYFSLHRHIKQSNKYTD